MTVVIKGIRRLSTRCFCVLQVINATMLGYSYCCTDYPQKERLSRTERYTLQPPGYFKRIWAAKTLPPEERRCVDAFTSLITFNTNVPLTDNFTANVILNDSLICLDGLTEMKDGWWFLSHFFESVDAQVLEVKKDVDTAGCSVLHVKYEMIIVPRILSFPCTFNSHATLVTTTSSKLIDKEKKQTNIILHRPKVSVIEHRWWGGPILSRMTDTQRNILGDVGDLCRRMNGFTLSLVMSNPINDFHRG
eukprot:Tbor_TRINITY_DN5723_c4_g3::TRINITY_DN5723_c4_g3_i1::g.20549::m.20549